MSTILSVQNLTKAFYALKAVDNVSFEICAQEILGIIGPNGSGKTTLFNCISGIYKPEFGRIVFEGRDIAGKSMYNIAKAGIRRTFQTIRLFKDMSVAENIYSGYYTTTNENVLAALTHFFGYKKEEKKAWDAVMEMVEFFNIAQYATHKAGDLAYGIQRKVEMARALISKPRLIILDEPAAGMNSTEKMELAEMIRAISGMGVTVLIIEHDMEMMMGLCQRIIVLNQGGLLASGLPEEIQSNQAVIEAYMGADDGF
jgi:branched-chain amino acid transport system ATP-binding protein